MSSERRSAARREIDPLKVSSMSLMEDVTKISRGGVIIDASKTGFLLEVRRDDLVPKALRANLNIDTIVGQRVLLYLPQMNLELSGKVARTKFVGKNGFEIAIDFTDDAPEYWRECLLELLPLPGELNRDED
jgi:hypothetical protein